MSDIAMVFRAELEEQLATKLILLPVLVQVRVCVDVGGWGFHGDVCTEKLKSVEAIATG
jgi:hypothetical protein